MNFLRYHVFVIFFFFDDFFVFGFITGMPIVKYPYGSIYPVT
jgi:hypothetical protein